MWGEAAVPSIGLVVRAANSVPISLLFGFDLAR